MRALLIGGLLWAGAARADVTQVVAGATVDWSHGTITATGVGPADRHAPAPAVARDAALARAAAAARATLVAAAKRLPGAEGASDAALAAAAARAAVVATDVGTDGSATVALALPIEAVRVAIAGPRRAEPAAQPAPPVVIVDASRVQAAPRVGPAIAGWHGPVLYVDAVPADGDPRVGDHPVRRAATAATADGLAIDGDPPAAGALAVVVIGGKT